MTVPSSKPDIDLTRDENYPFYPYSPQTQKLLTSSGLSKEDEDLQRAIQESTNLNTTTGSQVQGGGNEGGGGEDDLDKALKLSMASLGSLEGGEGGDQPELSNGGMMMLESIPAFERLRDSLET